MGQADRMVVVITGASSGIGRAAALRFAADGDAVVLAARRRGVLEELARTCEDRGGTALAVSTDVRDERGVRELADLAVRRFGRIDVWVNNAGVSMFARFEDGPPELYRQVIETNLFGTIHGTRAVLPIMREQGHGTIINNASVFGKAGAPYLSAYVASKHGMVGFSESLRMELVHERDIHVVTLLPASIDTPIFQHAANLTGRSISPLPPIYDVAVVAGAIVRNARSPRREVINGGAGRLLFQQRMLTPALYEWMTARIVERGHFGDAPEEPNRGNVEEPVDAGVDVSGGWGSTRRPVAGGAVAVLAGVGAATAAVGWLRNRSRDGHDTTKGKDRS